MIINEKQILELLNIARWVCIKSNASPDFVLTVANLIHEIELQQSQELRVVE